VGEQTKRTSNFGHRSGIQDREYVCKANHYTATCVTIRDEILGLQESNRTLISPVYSVPSN